MDISSMWFPELISQEIEDHEFISYNDKMIESYDTDIIYTEDDEGRFFQTTPIISSFEEQVVDIKCQKASNEYNINKRSHQTPKASLVSSSAFTISFGEVKSEVQINDSSPGFEAVDHEKVQTVVPRGPVQAQDHVLSERKRREKLNQLFISMSALLPNLKKLDKASVLEDAANHIRELQDRVKELEGLSSSVNAWDAKQSVVLISKNSRLITNNNNDDDLSPTTDHEANSESADCSVDDVSSKSSSGDEIEVRMSQNHVLIRIQSQKNSLSITKVLSTIHKIGLSVISSSTMPFANTATLFMIVAQIEDDFFMTATDLARNLQQGL
uniref:transcription factor bHLH18-like n=1 Tax=Erigeron canadensis TaxID=72917 RepID=UPI001CB9A14A|nr:transcription factor bHLH18-like [Erigeron canadensis]